MRRAMAYWLFNLAGRLLPADERARLLRVLRTGTHEESVPVDEVVRPSPAQPADRPTKCDHGSTGPHSHCPHNVRAATCNESQQCPGPPPSGEVMSDNHVHDAFTAYDGVCKDCDPTQISLPEQPPGRCEDPNCDLYQGHSSPHWQWPHSLQRSRDAAVARANRNAGKADEWMLRAVAAERKVEAVRDLCDRIRQGSVDGSLDRHTEWQIAMELDAVLGGSSVPPPLPSALDASPPGCTCSHGIGVHDGGGDGPYRCAAPDCECGHLRGQEVSPEGQR